MKRIYYQSIVANILLYFSYCETITVGPFIFTKLKEEQVPQNVRNHECTHVRQWTEIMVTVGLLLLLAALIFGISTWWLLVSPIAFYLWYGLEYLVRLCLTGDGQKAYKAVSFEQEAYGNEHDVNYNENAAYFSWVKYLTE